MQKTIQFSGHTAVPSDHDAPDGTLAQAFNLSADTGLGLQPLGEPITVDSPRQGWTARYIHNLPSGEDAVIYLGSDNKLAFALIANERVGELVTIDGPALSGSDPESIQFTSIGNILIAHSQELSMQYYLWRGDSYQALGNRPGFPVLEFGLKRIEKLMADEMLELNISVNIKDGTYLTSNHLFGYEITAEWRDVFHEFYDKVTNAVYGKMHDAISRKIKDKGFLFYQPFMIRYAYRLYDGTYLWHSAPVLMLPSTIAPVISVDTGETIGEGDLRIPVLKVNNGVIKATTTYEHLEMFLLMYRFVAAKNVMAWKDIISGIDIFVSTPFYTYEQSKSIEGFGTIAFTHGELDTRYTHGNVYELSKRLKGIFSTGASKSPYKRYFLEDEKEFEPEYTPGGGSLSRAFWRLPRRYDKLDSDVRDCNQFYRIARIDFNQLAGPADIPTDLIDLPLEDDIDYSNLSTRPTLPDDFGSHAIIYPKLAYLYNSRLNLTNLEVLPARPMPVRSTLTYAGDLTVATDSKSLITAIQITYLKNNKLYYSLLRDNTEFNNDLNPNLVCDFDSNLPIYLFVPDRDAIEIVYWYKNGVNGELKSRTFKLTPHDFLNGAYYFSGISGATAETEADSPIRTEAYTGQRLLLHNQLYSSQVNNPFVFPAANATTVGNGKIMALASAAKPLSQGQFGQYPLYAFTDEGVWALSISDTGSFSARQPITRHTLASPHAICTLDSSVAFIAPQGLMLLSGSQATNLSHPINTIAISSFYGFKGLAELLPDQARYILPLSLFLKTARIAYDSTNSRIILYRPVNSYAYIYNIRSQQWTLMAARIHHTLNSYPITYAVDTGGAIIKPFRSSPGAANVAIITRPLKLDQPDALKTIRQLYIRGQFTPGHIQCALYGSRDFTHWHLIASSRDHRIRRISGTPYKYFVIAVLGQLSATESITAADIDFTPRYNNRLR